MSTCAVCCETLNKSTHKLTPCPYCSYNACRECFQKYILTLDLNLPMHCMNCGLMLSSDQITEITTTKFIRTDYRKHLEACIDSREKTRMITAQIVNQMMIEYEEKDARVKELRRQLDEMKKSQTINIDANLPQNKIMFPCPVAECKGLINGDYVCGTCAARICEHCQVVVTSKTEHICNKETLKTLALIKKGSKHCPKCNVYISKIEGCKLMWCTNCKTKFDWNTGEVITGGFYHNPHHDDWRNAGGVDANGNADDAVANNECVEYRADNSINLHFESTHALLIRSKCKLANHLLEWIGCHWDITHRLENSRAILKKYAAIKDFEYIMINIDHIRGKIDQVERTRQVYLLDKKKAFINAANELRHSTIAAIRECIYRLFYTLRPPQTFDEREYELIFFDTVYEIHCIHKMFEAECDSIYRSYKLRATLIGSIFERPFRDTKLNKYIDNMIRIREEFDPIISELLYQGRTNRF